MIWIDMLGSTAAAMTTVACFPQAIKTLRTGETGGLSLVMYVLLVSGIALWFAYGVIIQNWPLIISNVVAFVPQTVILTLILRRRRMQ